MEDNAVRTMCAHSRSHNKNNNKSKNNNNKCYRFFRHSFSSLKFIACDPDWSTSKWFVTMDEKNVVNVWNLESGKMIRGHQAHSSLSSDGGAMCVTSNRQVLSIDRETFVKYCIQSNTYTYIDASFVPKLKGVCMLKSCPYDVDILAMGYRDGLISIVNLKSAATLQKLRAHDTEIVSLEWMQITKDDALPFEIEQAKPIEVVRSKKRADNPHKERRRDAPKAIVDEGDMFDIHSFDYLEEEFGVITKPAAAAHGSNRDSDVEELVADAKANVDNENFDFDEECQTLREHIVREKQDDDEPEENASPAVDLTDIRRFMASAKIGDGSISVSDDEQVECGTEPVSIVNETEMSTASTIGSNHTAEELEDIEKQMSAMVVHASDPPEGRIYLASGGREAFVVIWDVENGSICDKLQLNVEHGRMAIPSETTASGGVRGRN